MHSLRLLKVMKGTVAATVAIWIARQLFFPASIFAARAEKHVRVGVERTVSGGGTQPEPLGFDVSVQPRQHVKTEEQNDGTHSERLERRRRRSSTRRARLFMPNTKRSGTVWRLSSALFVVVVAVLVLWRVGEALWICLPGLQGVKQQDGSTLADSGRGNDNTCQELLGTVLEEGGSRGIGPADGGTKMAPKISGGIPGSMLTVAVLLAVLALASAPHSASKVSDLTRENMELADMAAPAADNVAETDENPPPVDVEGGRVIVGKDWKTTRGTPKQGPLSPITFPLRGKNYEIYLSRETAEVLYREGLLDQVRSSLSVPPMMRRAEVPSKDGPGHDEEATWIWGRNRKGTSVVYDGILVPDEDCPVGWKVHLPRGTFGTNEQGQKPGDGKAQAWRDLGAELSAALYVAETGTPPSRETFHKWFPPRTGIAAYLGNLLHQFTKLAKAIGEL